MRKIPESDWKKLRNIRKLALQRACQRILDDLQDFLHQQKGQENAHETYLKVYKKVEKGDKGIADGFDDWRRSTVYMTLFNWVHSGLLTKEEFESLSEETQAVVRAFHEHIWFYKG